MKKLELILQNTDTFYSALTVRAIIHAISWISLAGSQLWLLSSFTPICCI